MPIYKIRNTEPLQILQLDYPTCDKNHCYESVVVEFGTGDIDIITAIGEGNEFPNELNLLIGEPWELGRPQSKIGEIIYAPVRLVFNEVESLNMLIQQLEDLKQLMGNNA